MAATIDNGPGVPKLNRGRPVLVGTLTAVNHAVAFSLGFVDEFSAKSIVIQVPSGTVTTAVLEVSLDAGATWAVVPATALTLTGQVTGDAAASFGAVYNMQGFGGALFHFGVTSGTITSSAVWVLAD
jgi:hypothetical protein